MNNVWAVLWNDRHSDPSVHIFSSPDKAIDFAKAKCREYDRHGDLDEELTPAMVKAGWLYHGIYSCEGDGLTVFPCVVDADAPLTSGDRHD